MKYLWASSQIKLIPGEVELLHSKWWLETPWCHTVYTVLSTCVQSSSHYNCMCNTRNRKKTTEREKQVQQQIHAHRGEWKMHLRQNESAHSHAIDSHVFSSPSCFSSFFYSFLLCPSLSVHFLPIFFIDIFVRRKNVKRILCCPLSMHKRWCSFHAFVAMDALRLLRLLFS